MGQVIRLYTVIYEREDRLENAVLDQMLDRAARIDAARAMSEESQILGVLILGMVAVVGALVWWWN